MIETAKQRKVRFGYVGIDGGYGKDPALLRGIDSWLHICRGCSLSADDLSWRPDAAYSGLEWLQQAAETTAERRIRLRGGETFTGQALEFWRTISQIELTWLVIAGSNNFDYYLLWKGRVILRKSSRAV